MLMGPIETSHEGEDLISFLHPEESLEHRVPGDQIVRPNPVQNDGGFWACEPPRSRGVERRSRVGRLKTRFERPWCSNWPPAVRCSTAAPKGTRTSPLVRANSASRRRIAWLLLTFHAATRANYWLRTVPPELTAEYAHRVLQSVRRVAHPQLTSWTDSGDRFVATHTRRSWCGGQ